MALLFFVTAVLYAAVGQAGASGYLAVMGYFDTRPEVMKPTALALNTLVAGIGTLHFWRQGMLSWRIFYPFAILGFPFSLMGGAMHLSGEIYYPAVGIVLILSGSLMIRSAWRRKPAVAATAAPPFVPALLTGAAIGLISGITGTGGGIFLAPIILTMNWVDLRKTVAATAVYNLLNSSAALLGAYATLRGLPSSLPIYLVIVGLGAILGSGVGSLYLPDRVLRLILALILLGSGVRLLS